MAEKYYPPEVELFVGAIFDRLPRGLYHLKLKGTYPLYGRVIEGFERVSEHKLLVFLGYSECTIDRSGARTSDTTTVGIYGELEAHITNLKELK